MHITLTCMLKTTLTPANMNRLQRMPKRGGRRGGPSNQYDEAGPSNPYTSGSHHVEAGPSNPYASGSHHVEASSSSFNLDQFMTLTPPPNLTLASQDSEQFGNMFNNCYHVSPPFVHNVNRNTSPVSFGGFDMNVPWDESETQETEEDGRPRRNIRAPSCGTGGRLGLHH